MNTQVMMRLISFFFIEIHWLSLFIRIYFYGYIKVLSGLFKGMDTALDGFGTPYQG